MVHFFEGKNPHQDGQKLPEWLTFDPQAKQFHGTPSQGDGEHRGWWRMSQRREDVNEDEICREWCEWGMQWKWYEWYVWLCDGIEYARIWDDTVWYEFSMIGRELIHYYIGVYCSVLCTIWSHGGLPHFYSSTCNVESVNSDSGLMMK